MLRLSFRLVAVVLGLASVVAFEWPTDSSAQSLEPFEWPEVIEGAIPDLQLSETIRLARDMTREAALEARVGNARAAQARRLIATRRAVGRGPQPATIADGAVVTAVEFPNVWYGTVTWETGEHFTGVISSGQGVLTSASRTGRLLEFRGLVWGVGTSHPSPISGEFLFDNDEVFRGSVGGGIIRGTYTSADGERRFVGEFVELYGGLAPSIGYLEDRRGRLLAVVRSD